MKISQETLPLMMSASLPSASKKPPQSLTNCITDSASLTSSKPSLIALIRVFIIACIRFSGGDPTEPTTPITTPHHTTEHHTTAERTTAEHTTSPQTHPTGTTPTATPSPGGGSHTVTVILVVLAILAILAGLATAGFVAYKRKLQLPGMESIQGFINPNYRRMAEDSNIVSSNPLFLVNVEIEIILLLPGQSQGSLKQTELTLLLQLEVK